MSRYLPDRPGLRSLFGFAAATALISAIASAFTQSTVHTWYQTLVKPEWTPPMSAFAPAWTFIYASIAYAGWRIYRKVGWEAAKPALRIYGLQLFLNAAWPAVFFGLRNPAAGLVEIIVLIAVVLWMLKIFFRIDRVAGWVLIPYLCWLLFAAALTYSIWQLNS